MGLSQSKERQPILDVNVVKQLYNVCCLLRFPIDAKETFIQGQPNAHMQAHTSGVLHGVL